MLLLFVDPLLATDVPTARDVASYLPRGFGDQFESTEECLSLLSEAVAHPHFSRSLKLVAEARLRFAPVVTKRAVVILTGVVQYVLTLVRAQRRAVAEGKRDRKLENLCSETVANRFLNLMLVMSVALAGPDRLQGSLTAHEDLSEFIRKVFESFTAFLPARSIFAQPFDRWLPALFKDMIDSAHDALRMHCISSLSRVLLELLSGQGAPGALSLVCRWKVLFRELLTHPGPVTT